jgi:hypothetical protein
MERARFARFVPFFALIAFAVLAAGGARPVHGASFTVDATHDAVDATPGDGVCADAGGACTLRAAVMETNALPGADEVALPAGMYVLSIAGADEDAAAMGDLDVTDDLTLSGVGAQSTVIDGGGIDRVIQTPLFFGTFDPTVFVAGVTIQGGNAEHTDFTDNRNGGGGGVFNGMTGRMTLRDVVIRDNRAEFRGGGVYNAALVDERSIILERVQVIETKRVFSHRTWG